MDKSGRLNINESMLSKYFTPTSSTSSLNRDICRICHGYEGKLVEPCKCKGSIAFAHVACLLKWAEVRKAQERDFKKCCLCKTKLHVQPPSQPLEERWCPKPPLAGYVAILFFYFLIGIGLKCVLDAEERSKMSSFQFNFTIFMIAFNCTVALLCTVVAIRCLYDKYKRRSQPEDVNAEVIV